MLHKVLSWCRRYWWIAAICLPVVVMLVMVIHYVVNIPQWDELAMIPFFQKHDAHTLGIADFWAQHNEHRIFFPNLILYASALLTHWNVAVEPFISFVIACGTLALVLAMVWRTFTNRKIRIAACIFAAFLLFSPMQGENWLWGWQVEWYLEVFAVMLTVWALSFWPKRLPSALRLPVAIAAAMLATYSLGSGPIVWLVGLAILLLRRQTRRTIVVWLIAAAASLALYYYHFNSNTDAASKTLATHQPWRLVEYVFAYLGHPLAWDVYGAVFLGIITCAAVIWAARKALRKADLQRAGAPWAGLIIFGLCSAFSTGIGRLQYGVIQAVSARYMTIGLLFTLGAAMGTLLVIEREKQFAKNLLRPTLVVFGVVLLLVAYNYRGGWQTVRNVSIHYRWLKTCTAGPAPDNWCLTNFYPDANAARGYIQYMKIKHLGGF